MQTYCLVCKKFTENANSRIVKTKSRLMSKSICSICGNKKDVKMFMEDVKLSHIYKNELDKACFQHDMAYNKYKELKGRTQSDIVLKNKAFKIATNPN